MSERTYPRHVHRRGGVYRIIENAEIDAQAIMDGWVDHPPNDWPVPDVYREWDGVTVGVDLAEREDQTAIVIKPRGGPRKTER